MSVNELGQVLPSIDSFDVRYRVPEAPEFGVPTTYGTPGTPGYRASVIEANESLPSGGILKLRSCGGDVMARGNPSRFRHWHSVDGVADGEEALVVVNRAVELVAPDMPAATDSVFHRVYKRGDDSRSAGSFAEVAPNGAADLFRVDVCNTYACGSEANAREFLRSMARRQFGGVQGYLFRNGRTVHFQGPSWTVQYYAKWADPYLSAKWVGKGAERRPARYLAERLDFAEWLRAQGAVRHEVKLLRDWLKSRDMRRPSCWSRAAVSEVLAEFSPHIGFPVRRHGVEALRSELLASGETPRRVSRLCNVALAWARGVKLVDTMSRASWFRLRRDLLPFGIDIRGTPEAGAVEVADCDLKPLVLPKGFLFWNDEVASSVWRVSPEVCS